MHPNRQAARSWPVMIGIVGDRDPAYELHRATEDALAHASARLAFEWLPTEQIADDSGLRLARYAGLLVAPGWCCNMEGALAAIRRAREKGVPLLGTCGGFQHVVLEYIRDVVGFADADHEATNPAAPRLAVTALACSLSGEDHPVSLIAGTKAAAIYRTTDIIEPFFCEYGLNPEYRALLEQHGLVVSGVGRGGEARVLELPDHPFFLATLYVPQAHPALERPHPLVAALVAAAGKRAAASV